MQLRATRLTCIAHAARRAVAPAFTPTLLFASGEQGAWYDPSDMSTLFQDSAGTTPVTAVEQPVGRMLDKSGRGNHATQATAINRPVLSARVNLLTKTEQFDDAIWLKARSAAANTTATTDPLGGNTADKLTEDTQTGAHYVANPSGSFMATAVSYTFSCAIKAAERTFAALGTGELGAETGFPAAGIAINLTTGAVTATNGTFSASSVTSLGNGWWRCSITVLGTTSTGRFWVAMAQNGSSADISAIGYTGDSTSGIYIWGADLRPSNDGVGLPPYQRVNTATDYDTAGFPLYLRFNGTNSWMQTASVNFTGTDKMTVWAGVRKLNSGTPNQIVSVSDVDNTTTAKFQLFADTTTSGAARWISAGLPNGNASSISSSILTPAPVTVVFTATGDISAPRNEIFVNGVSGGVNTFDQGSGNHANLPIYIGAGPATPRYLNGRLYPLIIRGAQSTTDQITQTETWVNGKTRAYQ
jgi:hypothetical protein